MSSDYIEESCDEIMERMDISISDLTDIDVLINFLCFFTIKTREDDSLLDECESLYESFENEDDSRVDIIAPDFLGEKINLSEYRDEFEDEEEEDL